MTQESENRSESTCRFVGFRRMALFINRFAVTVVLISSFALLSGCPVLVEGTAPGVRVTTSLGDFVIELFPDDAPITVQNFLQYVDDDFYSGTLFHRVIPGFVVQGGGFAADLIEKETRPPIVNEAVNGIANLRRTVAMARTSDPDSAMAQFFVNLADNAALDTSVQRLGYAVFGRVVEGMNVLDAIAELPTETRGDLADVPVDDIVIERIERTQISIGPVLTPEAEQELQRQEFELLNLVRSILVDTLGSVLSGQGGG